MQAATEAVVFLLPYDLSNVQSILHVYFVLLLYIYLCWLVGTKLLTECICHRMVEDLHQLLTVASSQPKPFLLVSSDFTTLVSRFYAQLYEQ